MTTWTLFRVVSGQETHVVTGKSLYLCSQFEEFYAPQFIKSVPHRRYKGVVVPRTFYAFPSYIYAKYRRETVNWLIVRQEPRFICPLYDAAGSPVLVGAEDVSAVREMEGRGFVISVPCDDGLRVGQKFVTDVYGLPVAVEIVELSGTEATCIPVSPLLPKSSKLKFDREVLSELA